jgi:hypothetical protein
MECTKIVTSVLVIASLPSHSSDLEESGNVLPRQNTTYMLTNCLDIAPHLFAVLVEVISRRRSSPVRSPPPLLATGACVV